MINRNKLQIMAILLMWLTLNQQAMAGNDDPVDNPLPEVSRITIDGLVITLSREGDSTVLTIPVTATAGISHISRRIEYIVTPLRSSGATELRIVLKSEPPLTPPLASQASGGQSAEPLAKEGRLSAGYYDGLNFGTLGVGQHHHLHSRLRTLRLNLELSNSSTLSLELTVPVLSNSPVRWLWSDHFRDASHQDSQSDTGRQGAENYLDPLGPEVSNIIGIVLSRTNPFHIHTTTETKASPDPGGRTSGTCEFSRRSCYSSDILNVDNLPRVRINHQRNSPDFHIVSRDTTYSREEISEGENPSAINMVASNTPQSLRSQLRHFYRNSDVIQSTAILASFFLLMYILGIYPG